MPLNELFYKSLQLLPCCVGSYYLALKVSAPGVAHLGWRCSAAAEHLSGALELITKRGSFIKVKAIKSKVVCHEIHIDRKGCRYAQLFSRALGMT